MHVDSTSNAVIQVYFSNNSSMNVSFGFSDFSIEYFDSVHWHALRLGHNIVFPVLGTAINSSRFYTIYFGWFNHQPTQDGLYRVRLRTSVYSDAVRFPLPRIFHEIVAEFIYG